MGMVEAMRLLGVLNLRNWVTAPLLSKELRVAGRRRRNYALRCVYILVLMIFIASVWVGAVQFERGAAAQQMQMARAAKEISRGIVWFQFIAAQIVVIIVMSTAISDEIYGRTLSVLMTTPLSSRQIIGDKLVSRLLPVTLLIGTSLPLLAIVRALGGVPWAFLWVSLAITLATVLFVASVTLLFSTVSRKMYVVVLASLLSVGALMAVVPIVAFFILQDRYPDHVLERAISYVNPYFLLARCTEHMVSPARYTVVSALDILACCVLLCLTAGLFLLVATGLVRSVALRCVMGQPTRLAALHPGRWLERLMIGRQARKYATAIRRVIGPPMVWKELTCTLTRRQKMATTLAVGVEILLIGVAYAFPVLMAVTGYAFTHLLFLWIFLTVGVLFTLSTSATLISAERESGAWPVLLVTPLRDWDILIGKCIGLLRRCGPVWLPLLAYIVAFTFAQCFHPLAIVQMSIIILSVLIFLSATGFYFGARFNRTTEAVTANLILAATLWLVLPLIVHWLASGFFGRWYGSESFIAMPFVQVWWMLVTSLEGADASPRLFGRGWDAGGMTLLMLAALPVYAVAAQLFLWRAMRAFRCHIT